MKNRQMQFWRIVFTYVIAYYHLNNAYGNYKSGYIAVEFFFILSGYLLANKLISLYESGKLDCMPAWKYTWQRYQKYFPHCLYSFLVAYIINGVFHSWGGKDWIKGFLNHLPEVFLVQTVGLNQPESFAYNSVTWYLSVLLIVGYFIWYMMERVPQFYMEVICPLSVLIIYPYLSRTYGYVGEHRAVEGVLLNSAFLRGFAAINLGILAFSSVKNSERIVTFKTKIVSDICFLMGGVVLPSFFYRTQWDFLFIFLIFIGVVTGFTVNESKILDFGAKLVDKWAVITLAIYLNHKIFRNVFVKLWPECNIWIYVLWFVFITVYSIFTNWFVNKMVELVKGCMKIEKRA